MRYQHLSRSQTLGLVAIAAAMTILVFGVVSVYDVHKHVFQMAFPTGSEADVFRELGHKFCEQRNIPCRFVALDYDELFRRELLELKGIEPNHDIDDVIAVDDPWLARLEATGKLVTLVPHDIKADPSDFIGRTLTIACKDLACAKFMAVPVLGNVQLLGVNLDLRKKAQRADICDPLSDKGHCTWSNIIDGQGMDKAKTHIVLRGSSRNPFLTDFLPLLKSEDNKSLPSYLSIRSPVFTPAAVGAFVKFIAMARQAPESYRSMDDFDSQTLLFDNVATYAVTWSNTSMRSTLDLADIPAVGEAPGVSHVEHIRYRPLPGPAELGVWLLALPDSGDQAMSGVAKEFLSWLTEKPSKDARPDKNPLLSAAINSGNPPTIKAIYENKEFQDKFPRLGDQIRKSLRDGFARPRDENWDCMRQEMSDQLKSLALQATAPPQEPPGPHRDASDREHAMNAAKHLNLFVACIQLEQERIYHRALSCEKQEEALVPPALVPPARWACDPDEEEDVQRAVRACHDDLTPTEVALKNQVETCKPVDNYQDWKYWIPANASGQRAREP